MKRIPRMLAALFRKPRQDAELDEELRFHLDAQIDENVANGMPVEEGRRVALRDFGGVEQVKEAHRDARGWPWLESLGQDVRYAVRGLRRNPGFTAVAVLLLALGIGANTAIFSVLDAMMFRDLPVKDPDQLVEFVKVTRSGVRTSRFPYPTFEEFREGREAFLDIFGFTERDMAMRAGGSADRVVVASVSGEYFTSLGVPVQHGRTILVSDDGRANPSAVAVLSHGFWQRRFGGDPTAVGMTIRLNEIPVEVVGVMPRRFVGVNRMLQPDVLVPMTLMPRLKWGFLDEQESWTIRVFGRIRPGVELEAARAELEGPFRRAIEASRHRSGNWGAPEREEFLSQRIDLDRIRHGTMDLRYVWSDTVNTLALVVVLVLLLACANLAGLLMTRGVARARELGIRAAIGAGRGRLVRLLLVESALLAAAGGAAGLLVAVWLHNVLLGFLTVNTTHLAAEFQLDGRVLGFTFVASSVAALLFGVAPALRASNVRVFPILKGLSPFGIVRRPTRVFLTLQVAISLVLLVVAGLFLRTLQNLYTLDAGFNRESVLLATVDSWNGQGRSLEGHAFHRELTERVEAIPGVVAVALSDNMVFGQGGWQKTIWVDGYEYSPGERQLVAFNTVGPGFFRTARIPVLEGREFNTTDRTDSPLVVIVNRAMAEKYFPGERALGKRFGDGGPSSRRKYEIVGVVANSKYGSLREAPRPTVYQALTQSRRSRNTYLQIRTAVPPATLAPQIRQVAMDIDEGLLVYNLRTLEEQVDRSLVRDRMFTTWTGLFGVLALLLVCMGLYGVTAYGVERRTNEIGIRMALGALPPHIVQLVLRDTTRSILVGSFIGVPAALAVGRLIEGRLFGLSPADPAVIAGAVLALLAAGSIACYRPVRRAIRVDATEALRHE